MKKGIIGALALFLIIPMQAQAVSGVGLELGYGMHQQSNTGSISGVGTFTPSTGNGDMLWVELEHPIPLIPNLRFTKSSFSLGDTTNALSATQADIVAYYNLLDTGAVVDVGAGLRSTTANVTILTVAQTPQQIPTPILFAHLAGKIPGLDLTVGYRYTGFTYQQINVADTDTYVNYQFAFGLGVQGGLRSNSLAFDYSGQAISTSSNGVYIAVTYKLD